MSSSLAKSKLKAARDAIGKKDYAAARDAAGQVLDYEPDNYNAHVFLALALSELGNVEDSEKSYKKAIELNKEQVLAWQGISKLYEKNEKWSEYVDTLVQLMKLYSSSRDAQKCAETYQKVVQLRRERGSRREIVETLRLSLPSSPFHSVLSELPPPDYTNPSSTTTFETQAAVHNSLPVLTEMILLIEKDEEEFLKKEVDKRRMRLGSAGPEQLRKEVGREIWGSSQLPELYTEVLNHPNTSDELRRETDSKLLRYKHQYLFALPSSPEDAAKQKEKVSKELDELVSGTVLLAIPDELAWTIFIEGKDVENIEEYDFKLLRQFMSLFPSHSLATLLKGYFLYFEVSSSSEDDDDEPDDPAKNQISEDDDPMDLLLDSYSSLPTSIVAHRILSDVYLEELDYANTIKVSQDGLELLRRSEQNFGRKLERVRLAFKITLATALVHLYPPKHHVRAIPMLDEVLQQDPDNVSALMGRAYVLQAKEQWRDAHALFNKVAKIAPDNRSDGLRAGEEAAWCQTRLEGQIEAGIEELKACLDRWNELEDQETDSSRCLWRIGKCLWDSGRREESYSFFIQSLKRDPSYAPAFTSLGIYYSDFTSPPDPTRASKCFQKAFELDAREAEAAQRLAEGFADERDWDLVEVVARRTIEGEGGLDAGLGEKGRESAASQFMTKNAWAWKAVGVVELSRRNYHSAIQALQIALRANPDDGVLWLRLGEAYNSAGRHSAAVRALERSKELRPDDWMCSYFLGDVHRQMGQLDLAINTYSGIMDERPDEVSVVIAMAQTHLDHGFEENGTGFIARAESSFLSAIETALHVLSGHPGFRAMAWKAISDALYALSQRSSFIDEQRASETMIKVSSLISQGNTTSQLSDILSIKRPEESACLTGAQALEIAIMSYDYRLGLKAADESTSDGSLYYDFAVALMTWISKDPPSDSKHKAEKKVAEVLTKALRLDPGNDLYWAALGDAKFNSQPKIAQHAYIKALEINSKNVAIWCKLGFLYLHHEDLDLANEAFYRAQTLDPDYPSAWVGQALVATSTGHTSEYQSLLQHAVGLGSASPEADLEYSSHVFKQHTITAKTVNYSTTDLLVPFFVLERYCKQRTDDATALHLFALICETLGKPEYAEELMNKAISVLEAAYEESEDSAIEKQFVTATSNVGRFRVALGDFSGALEAFETALGLLGDPVDDGEEDSKSLILRVHAHFLSGMAQFNLGNFNEALQSLETAIECAKEQTELSRQVSVVLSQLLWTIGSDEGREAAKSRLLACIADDPENLAAITALAGMGILTDDESLIDAALSEILALPIERRRELDPQGDISYLLVKHSLSQGDAHKAISIAQASVFAEPSKTSLRDELAILSLQSGLPEEALAVVSKSPTGIDNLDDLVEGMRIKAIAEKRLEEEDRNTKDLAQRAVMLCPWDDRGWRALALARTHP